MTKKKVFVISHSHWDREWYMPFEQHHMRLVTLIDNLLDVLKMTQISTVFIWTVR